ncbi:MAG: DoxX-like family protein [Verrucomicrobiota bacterium]
MVNVLIILILLLGPYFGLAPFSLSESVKARVGITCVFLFTGLGHFLKRQVMTEMVPRKVPESWRIPIIYLSGVFEIAMGVLVLVNAWARIVGAVLCIFLVLVLPANVDSAIRRVPFGGHGAGPIYLLVRIPLQMFLIGWIWQFAIHQIP